MLERIPKVGLTTAKKIHAHFNDMTDFVTNWTDRPCMKTNSKTHQAIAEFLLQPWGEPKEEREILGSRTEDSPTPMSLGKKQTNLLDEGQC
jgi:hypothetical protein